MTKSSMPRPWVKGCAFGDTPANSSKGLLGFQASQHPRSMWKVELALLLTRDELRIPRQFPPPSAPGTHRCLEQVMGTLKLRCLSLEGGCDRIAFSQNLPGIPLESRQHPPPSIPYSEQMCYFCAVLRISSAQRGKGEEWHCTDMSGGSSWGNSGGQRLWQCC